MAARLTLTNVRSCRALRSCMTRAISSLPVPVSPQMRTTEFVVEHNAREVVVEKLFEPAEDSCQKVAQAEDRDDSSRHFEQDLGGLRLAHATACVRRGTSGLSLERLRLLRHGR
jgi:hypothetical protein